MLRAGIVGLPNVGKSTLFNALTAQQSAIYIIAAWSCRVAVTYPLGLHLLRKYAAIPIRQQMQPLLSPFLCVTFMAACVYAVQRGLHDMALPLLAMLFISMAVGAVSYALAVLLLHREHLSGLWGNWRSGGALKQGG